MKDMTTQALSNPTIDKSKLIWVGPLTALVAALVNVVLRVIMAAILPIEPTFPPFGIPAVAGFTAFAVAISAVVYLVIASISNNPNRIYTIVAAVAFVISIIPNIILAANPTAVDFPFEGATTTAFLALIVFHVAAAIVSVVMLTGLTTAE
jgi:hypothetical protein